MDGELVELDQPIVPDSNYLAIQASKRLKLSKFTYVQNRIQSSNFRRAKVKPKADPFYNLDKIYFISGDKKLIGGSRGDCPAICRYGKLIYLSPFWGEKNEKITSGFAFRCSEDKRFVFGWAKGKDNFYEPFLWDLEQHKVISIRKNMRNWLFTSVPLNEGWEDNYFNWFNSALDKKNPLDSIAEMSYGQILGSGESINVLISLPHFMFRITPFNPSVYFDETDGVANGNDIAVLGNVQALNRLAQNSSLYTRYFFGLEDDISFCETRSGDGTTERYCLDSENVAHEIDLRDDNLAVNKSRAICHSNGTIYHSINGSAYIQDDNTLERVSEYFDLGGMNGHRIISVDYVNQADDKLYGVCIDLHQQKRAFRIKIRHNLDLDNDPVAEEMSDISWRDGVLILGSFILWIGYMFYT